MFCPKCGKQIPEGELSCPECTSGYSKMINNSPLGKMASATSKTFEKVINNPNQPTQNVANATKPAQVSAPVQQVNAPVQQVNAPVQNVPVNQNQPKNVQPVQNAPVNKAKGFAIAGFILSFISGFIGLILSAVGLAKYKKQETKKLRGLAIAGLVLSILKFIKSLTSGFVTFLIILMLIIGAISGGNSVKNDIEICTNYNDVEVVCYVGENEYDFEEEFTVYGSNNYSKTKTVKFDLDYTDIYYINFVVINNDEYNIIYPDYYFQAASLDDYNIYKSSNWTYAENNGLEYGESSSITFMVDFDTEYQASNQFYLEIQIWQ